MLATFTVDPDEPMGFYVGTVRCGFSDEMTDENAGNYFQDPYDAEVFIVSDDPFDAYVEIKEVASGQSLYVNISDIVMILNSERRDVVPGPRLVGDE